MPKTIKFITTILLIYFICCLFIYNINYSQGFYTLFVYYMKIIYISYIFSLLTFLIFTWKHKRSIIYFLILLVIIIFNYCVIVVNQTDNIIPNYRFFDPLFLVHNYGDYGWNLVKLLKQDYVLIPYYLLFLVSISIIIDFLISKIKLFKKDKSFIYKIFNVISILLIIYFMGCFYILLFNFNYSGDYKYISEMYLLYVGSLIIFLLFNNKKKLSILYFLFIISIIIYNYFIILTNRVVTTAPLIGYSNKFLIYNGDYAERYSGLLQVYKFKVIFPYVLLLLVDICIIVDYVICKLKLKK